MSEKFSARSSPMRSNTFVIRANGSKTATSTSKRTTLKKTSEKIAEERKAESKNYREIAAEHQEFGTKAGLNLTLVGSPAPRSQVRALVSSTSINVAKSKGGTRHSYGSAKLRETNPENEICMEKLYQFADNPTKFVRAESRDMSELKLDLEFSERSDEPEDYYDSHNIAFGENGEYRNPEYDHIRFLQFTVGESQDPCKTTIRDGDDSASVKFDRLTETCMESPPKAVDCNIAAAESHVSTIFRVGSDTPRSLLMEGSIHDLSEAGAPIAEFVPWTSKAILSLNRSGINPIVDGAQTYPLGSAINYKNNINPEVEKFMLDLEPELSTVANETFAKTTAGNRLLDESILSKNLTGAVGLQPLEESTENSSRSSPQTSRTTLSQASSSDGTWHGHSLNSPYFASKESNSRSESKRNGDIISGYEEAEEYLTIVKNERNSGPSSEAVPGVQRYIFITDKFAQSQKSHDRSTSESMVTEPTENHSTRKIDSAEKAKGNDSSDETTSDYCISKMFPRSSSSSPSSFSSSVRARQAINTENPAEEQCSHIVPVNLSSLQMNESNSVKDSNVLYMTLEEMNLAADYTTKLSQIFNRVLKRSESKDHLVQIPKRTDASRSNARDLTSGREASPNFCSGNSAS